MISVFAEQKVMTICMFTCLALSIFLKIFLGMLYRHMIKEADNMAITSNKLLKQCKIKFSNCYELNNGIHNIPVFVDKFINRLSLGHFSFDLLYHLSGQLMLLSVVSAGIGICRSMIAGRTLGAVLPFYVVSFLGMYLYFSVSTVADIKGKRRMLKINLVDYLENHLSSRMNVTKRDLEMLYGEAAFQEKITDGKAGAGRGRAGRKTVELMPVSGRLTAVKDRAPGGEPEGASSEAIREARRMMQGAQEAMHSTSGLSGEAPGAEEDTARRAEGGISQEAAVTEEELEMLLKEFLTG